MKSLLAYLTLIFAGIVSTVPLHGDFDPFNQDKETSTFISEKSTIVPGEPFTVALKLDIKDKWHAYYVNPGLIGNHMAFKWDLPEGFTASSIQWQTPHISKMIGLNTYGYSNTCYFPVVITPPSDLTDGENITLKLKARWQICDDQSCVNKPGPTPTEYSNYSLSVKVGNKATPNPATSADFSSIAKHQPQAALDWKFTASDDGNTIRLNITPPSSVNLEQDQIYFFDEDGQIDAQAEQKFIKEGDVYTLSVPRFKGNDLVLKPGPALAHIKGILSINDGKQSYFISAGFEGDNAAALPPVTLDGKTERKLNILSAIGFAFLGGMILNLMPCVFPVLGLKIMGFVQQAGEDPKKIKIHGLVFGAGLLISLWVLAGVLIALITFGGKSFGWGFQLNDPYFLAGMIVLIFVLALNLTGVFEMGTSLTGVGGELQSAKGYKGSFFSGVLTTLIATPCTGPFLGTTMGYTLQQPPFIALIIFTALGLGIASPYILLSFFPALIKKLPRPGAWMETFKQVMAFPLYATVVFFLSGFGSLTGTSGLTWMLAALLIITIALWIYGRWFHPMKSLRTRGLAIGFTLLFLTFSFYTAKHALAQKNTSSGSVAQHNELFDWQEWKPDIVPELQEKGHIVFMDYTADT